VGEWGSRWERFILLAPSHVCLAKWADAQLAVLWDFHCYVSERGGTGACKAKRISNRARKKAGTDRRTGRRNNKTMGATSHITVYKHHTNHTKAAAAEL